MIDMKNLSYDEKRAIEELRMRLGKEVDDQVMVEDPTLYYRFLKARDFNIEKAEKMLRKNIKWRKAKQINSSLDDFRPKEVFMKYLRPTYLGFTKIGDILIYFPSGRCDGKELAKSMKLNDYIDHMVWFSERQIPLIREPINKVDQTYPQVSAIFNLDKLTFANATGKTSLEICSRLLQTFQDNYPETLNNMFVINAPRYYVIAFAVLKTMMSNALSEKFYFFGHDGWKEALLKHIDADTLPAFLGGNRTDPDGNPLCKSFVNHAGPIPSYYFLCDEDRFFKDRSQVATLFVPKSSKNEVYVDVKEEGAVIQWEFCVKNKDIGFGLSYENSEEILPVLRYDTYDGTVIDSYRTKIAGKYIFVFDNSYSWLSSKEIEYTIKITNPTHSKNELIN